MKKVFLMIVAILVSSPVLAQTTYVRPDYNGGYVVTTPGVTNGGTTYIRPDYNGGYTVTTPGRVYNPY